MFCPSCVRPARTNQEMMRDARMMKMARCLRDVVVKPGTWPWDMTPHPLSITSFIFNLGAQGSISGASIGDHEAESMQQEQ